MNETVGLVLLGLAAGVLSGLLGIGGAVVIIPALVFFFGFPQHRAAGTTLALFCLPIGLLGVMPYFKRGMVDVRAVLLICAGFLVGGFIGGHVAVGMTGTALQKVFAVILIAVAVKLLLK